jgi:DNA-binding XRE family transcriptional regulator
LKVSLKALRVNADLNQKEAARELGVTEKTIQNWESSETFPTAAQLMKICSVYSCTLNDIYLPDKLA